MRKDSGSYTATAKLLHWLMAAMWITAAALGVAAVYLRAYVNTDHSVTFWHKAIASALLFLLVARVAWRVFHHPPEMPDSMSAYMRRLAHMGHVALYAVALLALPMSGWVWSSVADKPIMVLGVLQLPPLMAPDPGAYATAKQVHFSFAWLSIVLVLGHIAAALKHHLIDKDSVLLSMLPNKFSDKQTRR
ncbi:MAG: cytochrome B [Stenotrophomonas sp.]|nr:MAG: cytochrome B [Stenotrophomonas sp.]